MRTAEHQVAAARVRLAQADAARPPSFKLSGSLGLNALTLGGLSNGAAVVGALLAGVSLPVLDGCAGRAQVRAQLAALDEAHQSYQATLLTALKEEEDALVALRGDRERLLRLQNAAEAAGTAARLARLRYQNGLVDFQVVLETQRGELGSQDSVASATADIGADHVRLYKALGGGWYWQVRQTANAAPSYTTQAVTRGNLTLTVTANGTLQPTRAVNIGSELSGTVLKVNVDVNDQIRKGQVLVELDTAKLRDQILRTRASLAAAEARGAQVVATVKEARSSLARFKEVARLPGGKVPAKARLGNSRATLARAIADETSARANVAEARAVLSTDQINLPRP